MANSWHVRDKVPWPTLTRRLQFYIDHPFFEELGEVLPVHKDNPPMGGNYPLQMTSGHTRWSIHAAWRDHNKLLQLQRGGPVIFVSPNDARKRGIDDGDRVRYHAWEPFQFKNGTSDQVLTPSPLKSDSSGRRFLPPATHADDGHA